MAFKIIWSETASEDLKEIVQFISLDNSNAARRLAEKILSYIESARNLPLSNRAVPEKEDELIREFILKPYRIIYQIDNSRNTINILRIWHGARGIPEIE